ncbi:MAG: hypothetical protein D6732_26820 [Methanobacteriota archaeon]|nr:MAG: hypothetical protein D6732_26820 [Euryarchaeota archaeon]
MLDKIFGGKEGFKQTSSFSSTIAERRCEIQIIIIIDSSGKGVFSYVPETSKIHVDESLVSMFISAINNFSQEIFNQESNPSIVVDHGSLSILVESKEEFCVAVIGRNPNEELKKAVLATLEFVNLFYKDIDFSIGDNNFEMDMHLFVKQRFRKFIES